MHNFNISQNKKNGLNTVITNNKVKMGKKPQSNLND